ncbi:di-trans,poly-cis-decaprenylcistransferase [Candidatus Gracilibacteria bacterium]|nr:MAG: di-trans,poly-cis-decaprenylcistransferase [Candidatus Gracilibacteria bacterium]
MINHLGIIMDGNRRWAKSKCLPAISGHKAGADNVVKITELAKQKGIKYLTLWALSTDNLKKRPEKEVRGLIKLINNIEKFLGKMLDGDLKFETIGNINQLPKESQDVLKRVKEKTKDNNGITLIIALVYGGQDEIIRATKKIIASGIKAENLSKQEFRKYLDTSKFPNPDIIVRTGGDIRHSGFLLFDSEYSEYYFTEKKWPEFDENELDKVIEYFNKSKRNFGK